MPKVASVDSSIVDSDGLRGTVCFPMAAQRITQIILKWLWKGDLKIVPSSGLRINSSTSFRNS